MKTTPRQDLELAASIIRTGARECERTAPNHAADLLALADRLLKIRRVVEVADTWARAESHEAAAAAYVEMCKALDEANR